MACIKHFLKEHLLFYLADNHLRLNSILMICTIEKMVFGGAGFSRINGKAVFIDKGIPGETVELKVYEEKKDYSKASIIKIIDPSSDRIEPTCSIYGLCGGCSYQHITYERELHEKKNILSDTLTRISRIPIDAVPHIKTISSERFGYRSHARIRIENNIAGFYENLSHNIIPFPESGCLLLHPELRNAIRSIPINGEVRIAIDHQNISYYENEDSPDSIIELVGTYRMQRGIDSFFQANRLLREKMIEEVLLILSHNKHKNILELGCGVGFFSLPTSKMAVQTHAIDINRKSIDFAKKNARLNNISSITFSAKSDETINAKSDYADCVVVDPPRTGLAKKTRESVIAINPEEIVYISCNPPSFARDSTLR